MRFKSHMMHTHTVIKFEICTPHIHTPTCTHMSTQDDLLASLLDHSVSVIGAPLNFDLDTQNHFPSTSCTSPMENNGYHSDTSHSNQANSPASLASMSDQLSSPSHSPLVSSTLPDLQPLVGMETPFEMGAYEELGVSNAMMTVDGSSTSSSPPPPPDVCIDVGKSMDFNCYN